MALSRLTILILIVFLFSCSQNKKNRLIIVFDRVDNLEAGSNVTIQGLTVGRVRDIKLFQDSVLVEIELPKEAKIPVGSTFHISPSILGTSRISIEKSDDHSFLSNLDTLRGSYDETRYSNNENPDSLRKQKILHSLDKISDGVKEMVSALKDSSDTKK